MSTISTLREAGIKAGIALLQNIGIVAAYEKKFGALAAEIPGCGKLFFALQYVQHFHDKDDFPLTLSLHTVASKISGSRQGILGDFERRGYHIAKPGKLFEPDAPGVFLALFYKEIIAENTLPQWILIVTREQLLEYANRHAAKLLDSMVFKTGLKRAVFTRVNIHDLYAETRAFWGSVRDMIAQRDRIDVILKYGLFPCRAAV